jgi:hypothetical protein
VFEGLKERIALIAQGWAHCDNNLQLRFDRPASRTHW